MQLVTHYFLGFLGRISSYEHASPPPPVQVVKSKRLSAKNKIVSSATLDP
jgi:hypothetical protein